MPHGVTLRPKLIHPGRSSCLPADLLLWEPGGGCYRAGPSTPGRAEAKPEGEGAEGAKTECASFRPPPGVLHIPPTLDEEQWPCGGGACVCDERESGPGPADSRQRRSTADFLVV